ncbi:hypothetical protein BHE90_005337 [Fusarium euwallaceae]|nr:hypothetical protein BHE90_005337 [Fusarium euwallaceae]
MDGLQERPDDSYFIIKRDEARRTLRAEIKPSVTQWIAQLRELPSCTNSLRTLLDLIENRMLVINVEERIQAAECVSILAEAVSQVHNSSDRILPLEDSTGEHEEGDMSFDSLLENQHPQKNSVENLRLEVLSTTSHKVSNFDKLRLRAERHVGHQLDWYPFPPVNRRLVSSEARLIWHYGGKEMSIFLNRHQLERYRNHIRAFNPSILPTNNAPQSSSPTVSSTLTVRWHALCSNIMKALRSWQRTSGPGSQSAATTPPSNTTASTGKESYFCVDKYWTGVKQTSMYTVPAVDLLEDDYQLFITLRNSLTAARGSWLHRLSSWRICTGVKLHKFTFLFDNCDLVTAFEQKANSKSLEICKGYEYSCVPDLDLDEHMQLMAEIMLQGLQEPERGRNSRAVLDGIPKLQAPPGIRRKQFNSGWGFYTTQGFSLVRILLWASLILSPGVVFVPAWLLSISAIDLQNALAPISFLVGLVAILLSVVLRPVA